MILTTSNGDTPGYLELQDGSIFRGKLFGSRESTDGEVVFNTGMVGYVESLTDPSYRGQILTFTYPLIGNYGVCDRELFESGNVQVKGAVVSSLSEQCSHWEAVSSLDEFLGNEGITGIEGVDTRALTKHLRQKGTMLGRIVREDDDIGPFNVEDPSLKDLVSEVSPDKVRVTKGEGPRIALIDCGAKRSIERSLQERGCSVINVPYDHPFTDLEYDGVLISNGPGDPMMCRKTIANVKRLMEMDDPPPMAGICLGNQIMALAAGGSTYKLPFGHRSQNQPCKDLVTGRCVITSQNHGYAVETSSLPDGWREWYRNLNDSTVEGIRHETLPFMAVQFHPEASPGPTDASGFFDTFLEVVSNDR